LRNVPVVVKTTGVFRPGPFVETTEDTFHWHYNINVLGPVLTTLEAIKYFGDKGGSIINISSIVGSHPRPMIAIYSSTKSAVESLTRGLALELGGRNIRVNAIAPGHTVTEGTSARRLPKQRGSRNRHRGRGLLRSFQFQLSQQRGWHSGGLVQPATPRRYHQWEHR
jgi:NAD(P)-dependent dehydrogenase (short-subunit alcohol dehydrogenase family)